MCFFVGPFWGEIAVFQGVFSKKPVFGISNKINNLRFPASGEG